MSFPGDSKIMGYWPGAWTLGNLGRPGYGGTNHGVWPYTYDACERQIRAMTRCGHRASSQSDASSAQIADYVICRR